MTSFITPFCWKREVEGKGVVAEEVIEVVVVEMKEAVEV
jgi:hypothetical protein